MEFYARIALESHIGGIDAAPVAKARMSARHTWKVSRLSNSFGQVITPPPAAKLINDGLHTKINTLRYIYI